MKDKSSGFAGFLDGYKARNISASVSSIRYHFEEMKSAASDTLASQRLKNASTELLESLERISLLFSDDKGDFISTAISCGEILKKTILIARENGDPTGLLNEEKIKRFFYHYLEFAELSEDKALRDLAISVGDIF